MPTITNKTNKPLRISLPGGKTLRLGPFASAELSAKSVDHPPVQKLIEGGEVEVVDGGRQRPRHDGGGRGAPSAGGGPDRGHGIRKSGDR